MARRPDPIDIAAQQREREQAEVEEAFIKGMTTLRDLIAESRGETPEGAGRKGAQHPPARGRRRRR